MHFEKRTIYTDAKRTVTIHDAPEMCAMLCVGMSYWLTIGGEIGYWKVTSNDGSTLEAEGAINA